MLLASPGACFKLFQEKKRQGHGGALLFKGVISGYQCRLPHPSFPAPHLNPDTVWLKRGMAHLRAGMSPRIWEPLLLPLHALPTSHPAVAGAELAGGAEWMTGLGRAQTDGHMASFVGL